MVPLRMTRPKSVKKTTTLDPGALADGIDAKPPTCANTKPADPGGASESDGMAVKADESISEDMWTGAQKGDVARVSELSLLSSTRRLAGDLLVLFLDASSTQGRC